MTPSTEESALDIDNFHNFDKCFRIKQAAAGLTIKGSLVESTGIYSADFEMLRFQGLKCFFIG